MLISLIEPCLVVWGCLSYKWAKRKQGAGPSPRFLTLTIAFTDLKTTSFFLTSITESKQYGNHRFNDGWRQKTNNMRRLLFFTVCVLAQCAGWGQDSLLAKRAELISKLNKAFSNDWSYQIIDSSTLLKWDTAFNLPRSLIRVHIYHKNQDGFTTYFFSSADMDTVYTQVLTKTIKDGLTDLAGARSEYPLIEANQYYLAISFGIHDEHLIELDKKFSEGFDFQKPKVKIEDIREDETRPPPPPPPPRPKKTKSTAVR